jgi:hypothetical protein
MNYAQLRDAIALTAENFEAGFTESIDGFIRAAEQKIYNLANIPASNQNQQVTLTAGNRYLTMPAGFISVNEVGVTDPMSGYKYLVNKEVSFIREAYPNPGFLDVPRYYAQYDQSTLLLAPTPLLAYDAEIHFFGYPESIVDADTSWLGDQYDQTLLYGALIEAAVFMKSNVGEEKGDYGMYQEQFKTAMQPLMRQVGERNNTDNYRTGRKG